MSKLRDAPAIRLLLPGRYATLGHGWYLAEA
jgi:hypothetical protein